MRGVGMIRNFKAGEMRVLRGAKTIKSFTLRAILCNNFRIFNSKQKHNQ